MPERSVLYEKQGLVVTITLNRPRAKNALNRRMARALRDAAEAIAHDDSVRAVVLTATGWRFFCVGSDLAESPLGGADKEALNQHPATHSVADAIARIDRPVIVAINGHCLGKGLELALAGDLRIASEKATFAMPQVGQGSMPWDGGTQRLARLVGRAAALELLLTARTIDAGEALRIGLVNRVVPARQVLAEAQRWAAVVAEHGPIAARYTKEAVVKGLDMALGQGLALEADLSIILQTTSDRQEGIRSFFEKRKPLFRGE